MAPQPETPPWLAYGVIFGIDIELRELAELRSTGILSNAEYTEQKRRLLGA